VDEALAPLLGAGADVFVLGCTHYPFLRPVIERCLPDGGVVIDTGPAVARRVASLLPAGGGGCPGAILIETTGEIDRLDALLPRLLPGLAVRSAACRIGTPP
jgi:glutamate racemase